MFESTRYFTLILRIPEILYSTISKFSFILIAKDYYSLTHLNIFCFSYKINYPFPLYYSTALIIQISFVHSQLNLVNSPNPPQQLINVAQINTQTESASAKLKNKKITLPRRSLHISSPINHTYQTFSRKKLTLLHPNSPRGKQGEAHTRNANRFSRREPINTERLRRQRERGILTEGLAYTHTCVYKSGEGWTGASATRFRL